MVRSALNGMPSIGARVIDKPIAGVVEPGGCIAVRRRGVGSAPKAQFTLATASFR